MNPKLPPSINHWRIAFDPYGFANNVDWLKVAEKNEDILQLAHIYTNLIIDVGFYLNTYRSYIINNQDWCDPVEIFESISENEISSWVYSAIERYANNNKIST